MKIIFLDHDGVICLPDEFGGRFKKMRLYDPSKKINDYFPVNVRFDNFNKKAIKILNEILIKSDAEIVVSSDWRNSCTLEEIGEYYQLQGIIKKPIDFTKLLQECEYPDDFPWNREFELEQVRCIEIKQWLKDHPEVTQWVAVDDLRMGKTHETDWGLDNFVLTPRIYEGIKQCGIKENILKFII